METGWALAREPSAATISTFIGTFVRAFIRAIAWTSYIYPRILLHQFATSAAEIIKMALRAFITKLVM